MRPRHIRNIPPPAGVPYCSKDALASTDRSLWSLGYTYMSYGTYSTQLGQGNTQNILYCNPATSNFTCPLQSSMPYSSGSPQMSVVSIGYELPGSTTGSTACTPGTAGCASVFRVAPADMTALFNSMAGTYVTVPQFGPQVSKNILNNVPVKFFAQSLPQGLDSSTTYSLRPHGTGFAIASSSSASPLSPFFPPAAPMAVGNLVLFLSLFNSCPFQSKLPQAIASNQNPDGSLKNGACGYCLSALQNTGMATVPGAAGAALAILTLVLFLSRFEFMCKLRLFKPVVMILSVIAWVLILTALTVGFVAAASVTSCSSLVTNPLNMELLSSVFAPTPNGLASVGGYTPVTAKSVPSTSYAAKNGATFSCGGANGVACYIDPVFVPGGGAFYLIAAVVYLLCFLIFVGIRVDFSVSHSPQASGGVVTAFALTTSKKDGVNVV